MHKGVYQVAFDENEMQFPSKLICGKTLNPKPFSRKGFMTPGLNIQS